MGAAVLEAVHIKCAEVGKAQSGETLEVFFK